MSAAASTRPLRADAARTRRNDLPSCLVAAGQAGSPLKTASAALVERTAEFVATAREAGAVVESVDPAEVFELITGLSWTIDRFGKDAGAARRLVDRATAGFFTAPTEPPRRP
jgi:hypothetical protein